MIVKGLDGQRIIIYGGILSTETEVMQPEDSLYVLGLMDFKWYIPKVSGKVPIPRKWHRANVIGKYMVISYGKYIFMIILNFN